MKESKELSRVTARTLILVGKYDAETPVDMSEAIYRGVPGSQIIIFERSGHVPWIEAREEFFSALNRFLAN